MHPNPPPSPSHVPAGADEAGRRRRAGLSLGGFALAATVVLVVLVAFLIGRGTGPDLPPAPAAPAPGVPSGAGPDGWDVAAETALATRPMPALPDQAEFPHALSSDTAGPAIALPTPTQTAGRLVPGGFPDTPEGAVAAVKALDEIGFAGADPDVFARAYAAVALPGAAEASATTAGAGLVELRARVGLPPTGYAPDWTITYRVTQALIKGSTDQGRYVVACVLGEFNADYQGRAVTGGVGDCQPLRYAEGQWRIAPGAPAAKAPNAWPGSAEAVTAGYRAVS